MAELIVKLKGRELRRVPILRQTTKIGRDEVMDVVIDNVGISRHHASVLWDGDRFVVEDTGSQNGVFVNGTPQTRHRLREGDAIGLGKFELVYRSGGGVPPERLMRDSPLNAPAKADPRAHNPIATTALSSDDVKKMLDAKMRERAEERAQAAAHPTGPPQQGTLNSARVETEAQRQARTYKQISLALGGLVLALLAITLYLTLR